MNAFFRLWPFYEKVECQIEQLELKLEELETAGASAHLAGEDAPTSAEVPASSCPKFCFGRTWQINPVKTPATHGQPLPTGKS